MTYSATHLFLLLFSLRLECIFSEPQLTIRPRAISNPLQINLIVLGCQDSDSEREDDFIEDAIFFRNGEELFDLSSPVPVDPERVVERISTFRGEILFIIDLASEGRFSCGERLNSRNIFKSRPRDIVGELIARS